MTLYYQDDSITLYHGDSLEVLPTLDVQASALLTDPPYFKVKKDAWDNQWGGASQFLGWMGEWLDLTKPLLAPNATAWVFASPAMTTAVERVVGERFRVLNNIRWVKNGSASERRSLPSMRSFASIWEGIVFAEQIGSDVAYQAADYSSRKTSYQAIGNYLQSRRESVGVSRDDLAEKLVAAGVYSTAESANANTCLQELGVKRISRNAHSVWASVVELKDYPSLMSDYEQAQKTQDSMRMGYGHLRRPFNVDDRKLSEDIWFFRSVSSYKGRHPCEKPLDLLSHMIRTSTREGDLILDPFAGSGSTLEAARNLKRQAIGIEQDERYCEQIANRLSNATLDIAA